VLLFRRCKEAQNLQYVLLFIPFLVSEVILVDGHSTDDTFAVAKQLLPTIRIIKQAGKGKGNALKAGFAACTGDIIVMLDAVLMVRVNLRRFE
jgi:glycosyltransferase involved in cell wall biosynthesis